MTKSDFLKFIKSSQQNMLLNNKLKEMEKTTKWIKEYVEKLIEGKILCSSCNQYYTQKMAKIITENYISYSECVYTDCGYGDDDEYADVEYFVKYEICPICKAKRKIDQMYIGMKNRRRRN